MDLVEVSGGTYENAVMCSNTGALRDGGAGEQVKASTRAREGFFLNFAQRVRRSIDLPLMVTGGFRSRDGIEAALASKDTDIVGIARPLWCVKVCVGGGGGSSQLYTCAPYQRHLSLPFLAVVRTAWMLRFPASCLPARLTSSQTTS